MYYWLLPVHHKWYRTVQSKWLQRRLLPDRSHMYRWMFYLVLCFMYICIVISAVLEFWCIRRWHIWYRAAILRHLFWEKNILSKNTICLHMLSQFFEHQISTILVLFNSVISLSARHEIHSVTTIDEPTGNQ